MKTMFTPGPWVARLYSGDAATRASMEEAGIPQVRMLMNDGAMSVASEDACSETPRICLVDCKTPHKRGQGYLTECATRDANAHLIAAAPDLYAALERLLEQYSNVRSAEQYPQGDSGSMKEARAALAKARGEQ